MLKYTTNRSWSQEPEIVFTKTYRSDNPTYSLVMPIHNQASIIGEVLLRLLMNTEGLYEMFLILDGCTDGSREAVLSVLDRIPPNLCKLTLVSLAEGIFETSCDNLGFVNTTGRYIVEIQADMQILTPAYNRILCTPLEVYPDLIGVSGRCCHTLSGPFIGIGKIGTKVEQPHVIPFSDTNRIYMLHTVNRGPLALRRSMLEELNYLDEQTFVLGDDEHDLFIRAWKEKTWRTAFCPVEVYSPLSWGSTRKARPPKVQAYLDSRTKPKPDYDYGSLPSFEIRHMPLDDQYRAYQSMSL